MMSVVTELFFFFFHFHLGPVVALTSCLLLCLNANLGEKKEEEIMKNFDLEALKSALVNPVLFKSTLLTTQEAVP